MEELCRRLKPVIGEKAEWYWRAYLSEDAPGKRDLEIGLSVLAARLLGSRVEEKATHLSAPPPAKADGPYPLGWVYYAGRLKNPFGLHESEWIQHAAIFGRSGAGKTNAVVVVIDDFLRHKKPFLIFDWKRNYRDLLPERKEEILVYTAGRGTVPFAFNPLIPPEGTDASTWLKKLIEIIAHSYYLGEGVMFLLQEAIHGVYQEFGVYAARPERYPTFQHVLRWLEAHPVKGRKALWMDSTLRGVQSICFGNMGKTINTAVQPNLAALLERNVILELDALTNADKTFIIESLLLWIHHYRLAQPRRETFKHAMIVEEAHHILLKRTGGHGGEAVTDTILREIRELGEAIVLVDQHPSLISIPALGNTYTTIAMNQKHNADVNAVGAAMLMDDEQRDLLGRLPVGMAVVKLQDRWTQPFVIKIPHRGIRKGAVDDAALARLMKDQSSLPPEAPQAKPPEQPIPERTRLSEKDGELLRSVVEHPLLGMVERYRLLGVSRRKGNALRESCLKQSLLQTVNIPTRSGKVVLLDLTDAGKQALREMGYSIPSRSRWGSLEHEYWKRKAADACRAAGFEVEVEAAKNGFTDLVAKREGKNPIAIEIETGKSDWRANLRKNLKSGFHHIVILATNDSAYHAIAREAADVSVQGNLVVGKAQDFAAGQGFFEWKPSPT